MSFRERVRTLLDEGITDPEEMTDRLLGEMSAAEVRAKYRAAFRREVGHTIRHLTSEQEHLAFPERNGGSTLGTVVVERVMGTVTDELRNLLKLTFVLEDGSRVSWRDATVEQHKQRAAMLRMMADRLIDTADRHERAAEMIAEAGATCLGDLFPNEKVTA